MKIDECLVCGVWWLAGRGSNLTRLSSSFVSTVVSDEREREREREMFYLTTHSTHFIYGYMASDIW